eukprot:COSAG01_NODE_31705_length_592_cov_8.283976_1_plen_58_part_10
MQIKKHLKHAVDGFTPAFQPAPPRPGARGSVAAPQLRPQPARPHRSPQGRRRAAKRGG